MFIAPIINVKLPVSCKNLTYFASVSLNNAMKKVTLIIMRHGKSDWHTGENDFDRPLSERGTRDAARMGRWLSSSRYLPDQIIASPATRAKQTVELLCKESGLDIKQIVWEKSFYSTDIQNLLDTAKNNFDVVITDILMPGMRGNDVANHIRNSQRPPTAVIGISGTPWKLSKHDFDSILPKPFSPETLLSTIENVCHYQVSMPIAG